ncbi:MAG: GNAT family N-acetyltransferase [Anaerotignaceae bacterium]
MKTIRTATFQDIHSFRKLWDICFTDSLQFRDWFFEHRFIPAYSMCIEEKGKIVSAVQSIPCHMRVRGKILPATIMVGACTHPDYTRRGYMKELYTFYMNNINSSVFAAHSPAVLRTYFNVGHYPISDTGFIKISNSQLEYNSTATEINILEYVSQLSECYTLATEKYSGIISRSYADFLLKMKDYMADGGKCIGVLKNKKITAYGIYYNSHNILHGEEILGINTAEEQEIVNSLITKGKNKQVTIKLPPDTMVKCPSEGALTLAPRNVVGLMSVANLLKYIGKSEDFTIKVIDPIVTTNNGYFNLKGEVSLNPPTIEIHAPYLNQWLMGYKSIDDLLQEGNVTIYNENQARKLDELFPKETCHIIDEY